MVHLIKQSMSPLVTEGVDKFGIALVAPQVNAVTTWNPHSDGVLAVRPATTGDDTDGNSMRVQLKLFRDL
jgi:hypothetical protein